MNPLRRVRILDLTNVLAGPFCCYQLAHLGADVIKVEVPGFGDLSRQLGADPALNQALMGVNFLAQNAGKRSITMNFKSPRGKEVFRRLVANADVNVENFRPGVMDRLGLGFESLKQDNPKLIYCAVSGFGQDGPLRDLAAYDQIIQGISGVMRITGEPANAPLRVGYPIADTIGGITAALAKAAALAQKDRCEACFLDVSMLDATLATMGWAVTNFLVAGVRAAPIGNDNVTSSPSGSFRTGDGLLNIAANTQEQFETLCQAIGCEHIAHDERFSERQARLKNRAELKAILDEKLSTKSAMEWWRLLSQRGVPAGPVLSLPEVLKHPHVRSRDNVATFRGAAGVDRDIHVLRPGFKLNGKSPSVDIPPPTLGQHTEEILLEFGYTPQDLRALKEVGAI